MARLYKHKLRGWQLHYTVYFPDGTERKKYRHYRNKLLATDRLRDSERLENASLRGNATRDELLLFRRLNFLSEDEASRLLGTAIYVPTLGELAGQLLKRLELDCRPSVKVTNRYRVGHLLHFFGDSTQISSLTTERIESYRHHRISKGISAATVNKEMVKLAQIFDIAVEKKVVDANPARKLKKLKDFRGRKPRALTKDEIARLLETAKKSGLMRGLAYEAILCYLYTGMRRNELLYFEWGDISFDKRMITIQEKSEFRPKGRPRVVGLSKKLESALSNLPREGKYVFGGERPFLSEKSISTLFKRLVVESGLPKDVSLHTLRHTYISHLLEAGTNPRRVQELAGHASFGTTWKYSHVLPTEEVVEDLLDF